MARIPRGFGTGVESLCAAIFTPLLAYVIGGSGYCLGGIVKVIFSPHGLEHQGDYVALFVLVPLIFLGELYACLSASVAITRHSRRGVAIVAIIVSILVMLFNSIMMADIISYLERRGVL